jgi:predicted nucleotidyltransferase
MGLKRRGASAAGPAVEYPELLRRLAARYAQALEDLLGPSLVSVVLFGSAARGDAHPHSDIDLLVVAEGLPASRLAQHEIVAPADALLEPHLADLRQRGMLVDVSPILKTPQQVLRMPPLLLDMVEDAVILYDRGGFFAGVLARLRASLARLGARQVTRGAMRYWELKPDYLPGEIFEL